MHHNHPLPPAEEPSFPFTIYIEHRDKTQDKHWRPAAFIKLDRRLQTSGFLRWLSPEDLRTFLLLLTFLTPDGRCAPTLAQLAEVMSVSQAKARSRMQRLTQSQWQGKALVTALRQGDGQEAYTLSPGLIPIEEEEVVDVPASYPVPYPTASRTAVIAHSRAHYARPRAEVERQIAEQMGWELPAGETDETTAELRRRLLAVGVTKDQAGVLLTSFEPERIERQLKWLPYRYAKNPAAFLVAAIERDYEEPFVLRNRRMVLPEGPESSAAPAAPDNTADDGGGGTLPKEWSDAAESVERAGGEPVSGSHPGEWPGGEPLSSNP